MEWLILINLAFIPVNLYYAVTSFKNGSNAAGHLNMAAVVINAIVVANHL